MSTKPTDLLYKYLPPERETYLSNQLLRFTQPSALNDPFDCIPVITVTNLDAYVKRVIEPSLIIFKQANKNVPTIDMVIEAGKRKLITKYKRDPQFLLRLFIERYLVHANRATGVFSLSRRWNSVLMWSHYTAAHSGFCVGFRRDHDFFSRQPDDAEDIGHIAPVEYKPTRIVVPMDESFALTPILFYRKSLDWEYEEEERLIRDLGKAETKVIVKASKVEASPLDICLFKVPHSAIAEIVYGVYSDDALKSKILKLGKQLNVPVWESLISSTVFDMERRQVS